MSEDREFGLEESDDESLDSTPRYLSLFVASLEEPSSNQNKRTQMIDSFVERIVRHCAEFPLFILNHI